MTTYANFPPATKAPCNECPWRKDSLPGHLGPHDPETWEQAIHGEAAIACHKTIVSVNEDGEGDWNHPNMRQCAGAAQMRANVLKSPHNPNIAVAEERDDSVCFDSTTAFKSHHRKRPEDEEIDANVLDVDVVTLNALRRNGIMTMHQLDDMMNYPEFWQTVLRDIKNIGATREAKIKAALNKWKEGYL